MTAASPPRTPTSNVRTKIFCGSLRGIRSNARRQRTCAPYHELIAFLCLRCLILKIRPRNRGSLSVRGPDRACGCENKQVDPFEQSLICQVVNQQGYAATE